MPNKLRNYDKYQSKRKKHFADYVVYVSLSCVILYTIAAFVLQFFNNYEISTALTTCFFAFFGAELLALALIKKEKVKTENKTNDEILADKANDKYEGR